VIVGKKMGGSAFCGDDFREGLKEERTGRRWDQKREQK